MQLQKLATRFEIKAADDETGVIEGMGSVFDLEDDYGDVVQRGAFKATLASGRMPKMLYQHDAAKVVGIWAEARETEAGLYLRGQLAVDTQLGKDTLALMRMGAIDGLSIGFRIPKGGAEWDPETDVRVIKAVDLFEVSIVTFPANNASRVSGVKSLEEVDAFTEKDIERTLREAGIDREGAKRILHRHAALIREREADDHEARAAIEAAHAVLARVTRS